MFAVGDVVHFHAPVAGKPKYHVCICTSNAHGNLKFFLVSSEAKHGGNLIYEDGVIPGLPKSSTGETAVCCNMLLQHSESYLLSVRAVKVSDAPAQVMCEIREFVETAGLLSRPEIAEVLASIPTL